jgi:hypothetical protein
VAHVHEPFYIMHDLKPPCVACQDESSGQLTMTPFSKPNFMRRGKALVIKCGIRWPGDLPPDAGRGLRRSPLTANMR